MLPLLIPGPRGVGFFGSCDWAPQMAQLPIRSATVAKGLAQLGIISGAFLKPTLKALSRSAILFFCYETASTNRGPLRFNPCLNNEDRFRLRVPCPRSRISVDHPTTVI